MTIYKKKNLHVRNKTCTYLAQTKRHKTRLQEKQNGNKILFLSAASNRSSTTSSSLLVDYY